ncbi:MAG: hypothetical protein Q8755_02905, partial [Candidatus Phytoplasma australasiaticum]|nr:hypothetical protein [Candidatus Phytoplasma australasiaticum]
LCKLSFCLANVSLECLTKLNLIFSKFLAKAAAEARERRMVVDYLLAFKKFMLTEGAELITHHFYKEPYLKAVFSGVVNAMNICGFYEGWLC